MNKSFHIKKSYIKIIFLMCAVFLLSGCQLAPVYTDPDTGEQIADAARISLLKKSSIKTIYSTDTNVFYLMNTADLLASGCNEYGLLGQGNTNEYDYVVKVKLPERIKIINANSSMAAAVSDTNNIYIWGNLSWWDSESLVSGEDNFTYKKFSFNEIITDISVSDNHIAVITKKGNVYTLGYNFGQLGYDFDKQYEAKLYSDFTKVETDIFMSKIETNPTSTYMISSDGKLYGCSRNEYSELGYVDELQAVNLIESNVSFTALTTAGYNVFALTSGGDVYVCGQNNSGVLGLNSSLAVANTLTKIPFGSNKIKSVCGQDSNNSVYFLTDDNKVYACGANPDRQLYTENTNSILIAPSLVKIGSVSAFYGMGSAKFYIDTSDHLFAYGDNSYGQMPTVDANKNNTFVSPTRIYANIK